jgi:hypothetical protein
MKKQIILSIALLLFLTACKKGEPVVLGNSGSVEENEAQEATGTSKKGTLKEEARWDCYLANLEGNTIEMELHYNTENISGTLTYNFEGKDPRTGTFVGKLENNVLLADYTYQSEGVMTKSQIAFKLIDDQFVEGYGDLIKNGTQFKDPTKLEFNSNMPLKKVECP